MRYAFLLFFACTAALLYAQVEMEPPTTPRLKKALSELNVQDKMDVLVYAQLLKELSLDDEIVRLFDQLPARDRKELLEYARMKIADKQKDSIAPMPSTTVTWDKGTHDFGQIPEGNTYVALFTVTNTGDNPYWVKRVKSSCDCTVANYPREAVQPGQSVSIIVEFNSTNKLGEIKQGIVVYDNSAPNERSILYIKGTVVAKKN